MDQSFGIEVVWLPLGSGAPPTVRWSGIAYETITACRERRVARALFHAALEVRCDDRAFVIEMAPAWKSRSGDRGVVAEGPVGARLLGRSRWFRYEVRRWLDGVIDDEAWAVSRRTLQTDEHKVRRLLDLVPGVPTVTWGRDELSTGEMWNSNSVVAWLLVMSGHNPSLAEPPEPGRAPGWHAGVKVAARTSHQPLTDSLGG